MNKTLLALYGHKCNRCSPLLPTAALHITPPVEQFCWRIEQALIREGGFALIQGDPGTGKSGVLRLLDERLGKLPEVQLGAISHPSSNLADFYPPRLSDEAASQLLDLLDELATALENHYGAQIHRHHADLFADFDDDLPEF